MTLALPESSPVRDLPWIITIGPLDDDGWEPVVVGPYERGHALALAESVVADDELMAVVEPLLPLPSVDAIRDEVATARAAAEHDPAYPDDDEPDDDPANDDPALDRGLLPPAAPPTEQEVRAGFARIAATLARPPGP